MMEDTSYMSPLLVQELNRIVHANQGLQEVNIVSPGSKPSQPAPYCLRLALSSSGMFFADHA